MTMASLLDRAREGPEMDSPLQVRDTNFGAKIMQRFATLVGAILAAVLPVNAVQSQSQSKEVMTCYGTKNF